MIKYEKQRNSADKQSTVHPNHITPRLFGFIRDYRLSYKLPSFSRGISRFWMTLYIASK